MPAFTAHLPRWSQKGTSNSPKRQASPPLGRGGRAGAYPIECIEARNSRLVLVSLSLSSRSSIASTGFSWESALRSSQTFWSSSFSSSSSSFRVPDCSMLIVGKMLVHEASVQVDLHVAGPLELLEDDVVHPAPGVHDRRRHDRQRPPLLDVPGGREEPARPLECVGVEAAGQDLARRRDDGVVGAGKPGDRIEQDYDVLLVLDAPLRLL